MVELELTIQEEYPESAGYMRELLKQFESQHRIRVTVKTIDWGQAWQDLVKVAIYRDGADVSQIGNTWVSSLIGMNALLPFKPQQIRRMGGAEVFLPELWSTASPVGDTDIWSIPWLAYARLIYYRKDWLEKVGLDGRQAFSNAQKFNQTLKKLAEAGAPGPWSVSILPNVDILHNIASWIWHAGGSFTSPDGKRILFTQPEAMAGMRSYFELYRYLSSSDPSANEAVALGLSANAAVSITGPGTWIYDMANLVTTPPEVAANTELALPVGVPFIGASNLVIWKHTRHPEQAAELVQFLVSREAQAFYNTKIGLLPSRLDVLSEPAFANDTHYQVMTEALKAGRTFPAISLWGLIEDRLPPGLALVGEEVLKNPGRDIAEILDEIVPPLAQRIERTLTQHQ